MKKILVLFILVIYIFTLSACSGNAIASTNFSATSLTAEGTIDTSGSSAASNENAGTSVEGVQSSGGALAPISVEYAGEDLDSGAVSSISSYIKLNGDSISFEGSGATVADNVITITSAGVYEISGTLNDGQIIVESDNEETVVLVLDGVDLTYSKGAPIFVSNADKTIITLAAGTENIVTDAANYVFENDEDEPNAAIFSKDDLTINGAGSLTVIANYNNGIASKDDLKITAGDITVNAKNDGIKGRNSIAILDGTITVNAGADGLQANNDEDAEKGYVAIEGGELKISAGMDAIQAETRLSVSGGVITVFTAEGSLTDYFSDETAKGLKAGVDVTITGGAFNIDSSDDAIHSNGTISISGGDLRIASGDDGIHADTALIINGGNVQITKSYEGIESAIITINDGNVRIVANDDGINVAGGADNSSLNGRPGQNNFEATGDHWLQVHGGYIFVEAIGDGMDVNGTVEMTGGVVLINGPTSNGNGPLDYMGTFNITGGFLVAVGSAGMAQAPSSSSTQYSLMHNFSSAQAGGTMVHIESAQGDNILTFLPTKAYQSVLVSSPQLENGSTYQVYTGGSSTGTAKDGLYTGETYTPGGQVASYTISNIVTGANALGGGFPSRPGGNPPPIP
jgi:hypothetical protein